MSTVRAMSTTTATTTTATATVPIILSGFLWL